MGDGEITSTEAQVNAILAKIANRALGPGPLAVSATFRRNHPNVNCLQLPVGVILLAVVCERAPMSQNYGNTVQSIVPTDQAWQITAYSKAPSCMASTTYPQGGDKIILGIDMNGWFLSIVSPTMQKIVEGDTYKLPDFTSLSTSGTYYGKAINSQQVVIENLTYDDLYSWAQAKWITIVGLGKYNLKGSKEAMIEMKACGDALVVLGTAMQTEKPKALEPAPKAAQPAPEKPAPKKMSPVTPADDVEEIEL